MGAGIQLEPYKPYFQNIGDDEFLAIGHLRPYFFADGTGFEQNKWEIRGASKENRYVNFETPIAPGVMLTDEPELLRTVKLATVLVGTIPGKELGKVGVQSIGKFVTAVVNLIRLLKYKYGLNLLSSLNKSVVNQVLKDYRVGVIERLDVYDRLTEYLLSLSKAEIKQLSRSISGTKKPDFDMDEVTLMLGISKRAPQAFPVFVTNFKEENGFFVKNAQRRYLEFQKEKKRPERRKDTIRKELTNIKKFFAITVRFEELFDKRHRPVEEFLSDLSVRTFSNRWGVSGARTKNIPRQVMFKLMDRAIRWVVDYSDELLELRDRASIQYAKFLSGDKRGGSQQNRRHYASKQMRLWLTDNQIKTFARCPGAPYPITGFDSDFKASKSSGSSITTDQIGAACDLIAQGMTRTDAARAVGVSKASLSRILNQGWAEDGLGLDKVLHSYLPTACLLVIYCFTGRRQTEIESLTAGCCVESKNGPYIHLYSAKVEKKFSYFPTTKLVVRAVHILESLSESVRSGSNQNLLQVPTLQGGHVDFWQNTKMNEFAQLVEANEVEGESQKWIFSEHQFRRFFAQTYFYKYDAGDLPTLSWHMRHSSFSMTEIYLTDEAFGEVYDEVLAEKVEELVQGGGDGEGVQKDLKKLVNDLELQGFKRVDRLKERVKEIGLILMFVPDGICFGDTAQFKDRSQCLTKGEIQISSAKLATCRGCPNLCGFEHPQDAQSMIDISKSPMLKKLQEMAS